MEPSEIQRRIDQHLMTLPEFEKAFEIRMSTAGFCPRLMSHLLQNPHDDEKDLVSRMRLLTGEPIHEFFRGILKAIYGDDYQMAEEEVSIDLGDDLVVKGHPDGFIQSLDAVTEFKSVSEHIFKMVQNQEAPLGTHLEQANVYANAIGARWILFFYYNRNDGNYLVLLAPSSKDLLQKTAGNWKLARNFARNGELVPRPYTDATQSPCSYCSLVEKCYEGFKEQVENGVSRMVTDPVVVDLAENFRITRRMRLTQEKQEETLKGSLAKELINKRLVQAKFSWGHVEVKIGRNNNPLISIKETEK